MLDLYNKERIEEPFDINIHSKNKSWRGPICLYQSEIIFANILQYRYIVLVKFHEMYNITQSKTLNRNKNKELTNMYQ